MSTVVLRNFLCSLLLLFAVAVVVSNGQVVIEMFVVNYALGTPGGQRFAKLFSHGVALNVMGEALASVSRFLHVDQRLNRITLSVETFKNFSGVAYVDGIADDHTTIHLSEVYVGSYQGDVVHEISGLLYFMMATIWQYDAQGTAPPGVVTGIADFIRLTYNFRAKDWGQPGEGDRYDEGYWVSAYFLRFCEHMHYGFVQALNANMQYVWNEDYFELLLGPTLGVLWAEYKESY